MVRLGTRSAKDCCLVAVSEAEPALTAFQIEVARLFFGLPASAGFVLAGGAALAVQRLTTRPTQDLDLFTGPGRGDIVAARDAFEAAVRERGWAVRRVRDSVSFCRLLVTGSEVLIVDLALDSAPNSTPIPSLVGPTFALGELAGRKLVALFDRAEARDFIDVFMLTRRFSKERLLAEALLVDRGFDCLILADMVRMHARFADQEFPVEAHEIADIRSFFDEWAEELRR